MCTFEDDRTEHVCDVAIGLVAAELDKKFDRSLTTIQQEAEPTRLVAGPNISAAEFRSSAEQAIAVAQLSDAG